MTVKSDALKSPVLLKKVGRRPIHNHGFSVNSVFSENSFDLAQFSTYVY